MPREARKRSNTGIYHVMLRGIDKRDILFKIFLLSFKFLTANKPSLPNI